MSKSNTSQIFPYTKYFENEGYGTSLYEALQQAGSSFGVVTEFLYRIFPRPEVLPAIVLVYIEDKSDLWKFEAAVNYNKKFHLCLHTAYFFTQLNWLAMDRKVRLKESVISS